MHYYKDLGNGQLQEIIGGAIPADAIESAEPIVFVPPVVEPPAPYIPTDAELLEQAKQEKLWQIESKLSALDRYLPRALEDFWAVESYNTKKLPQAQQDRLTEKAALRAAYAAVEAAVRVAEVEAIEIST